MKVDAKKDAVNTGARCAQAVHRRQEARPLYYNKMNTALPLRESVACGSIAEGPTMMGRALTWRTIIDCGVFAPLIYHIVHQFAR